MDHINNQLTAVVNWVHIPDCFDGKPAGPKGRKKTHMTLCGKCCTSTISFLSRSASYIHIGSDISLLHDVKLTISHFNTRPCWRTTWQICSKCQPYTQTNYYDWRVYRRIQTHLVTWKKAETHLLLIWVKFAKLRKQVHKNSSGPYEQTSHWLTNVKWKWKWKHTNFKYHSLACLDNQSFEAATTGFDGRAAGP